jgi:hypothetical protein
MKTKINLSKLEGNVLQLDVVKNCGYSAMIILVTNGASTIYYNQVIMKGDVSKVTVADCLTALSQPKIRPDHIILDNALRSIGKYFEAVAKVHIIGPHNAPLKGRIERLSRQASELIRGFFLLEKNDPRRNGFSLDSTPFGESKKGGKV